MTPLDRLQNLINKLNTDVLEQQLEYLQMEKTLGNTDASGTKVNVKDVKFFGNGDTFKLLCKASATSDGVVMERSLGPSAYNHIQEKS